MQLTPQQEQALAGFSPQERELALQLMELQTRYRLRYDENGVRDDSGAYLFVREMLGAEPDDKQEEVLRAVTRRERRISVRSGHGVGKTTTLAWLIIWHMFVYAPQKTVCTAPTEKQLFNALAAETKKWISKLPDWAQTIYVVTSDMIRHAALPSESFCTFATSRAEQPEALAGVHAEHVLLIVDEASGIPEPVFEASIGSMSGETATTVLAGNPVWTSGTFFQTHNDPKVMPHWYRVHISCVNPDGTPRPRIAQDFIDDVANRYGIDSNAYRVRVLGEFPRQDDDTVIPYDLAESARNRDITPSPTAPIVWGLDCARFGDDESALAKRKGTALLEPVQTFSSDLDLMQLVGRVKAEYDRTPILERPIAINVDTIGIGSGAHDRLKELGLPVFGINVSEAPPLNEVPNGPKYVMLRDELWFAYQEWLKKRNCSLAGDEYLVAESVKLRYQYMSNGKIKVESKKELKKRGYPSPNRADAVVLTFAGDAIIASGGAGMGTSNWKEPLKRRIRGVV